MMKKLLLNVIEKKNKEFTSPIFILKGFSVKTINEITELLINKRNFPINKGKILIQSIEQKYREITKEILLSDKPIILLYEEAIKINNFDLFARKVILIDSGIATLYNYEGDVEPIDTEKTLFNLKSSDNILSNYYSEIIVEENFTKIAHLDIFSRIYDELGNELELIELFEPKPFTPSLMPQNNLPHDILWFESNGSDASSISDKLFKGDSILDHYNIIADSEVYNDPVKRREAERINGALTEFGVEVNWFKTNNRIEKEVSEDVANLFIRYWGNNAQFRPISIYDAPEINNEIVEISQGEIVEQIIDQARRAFSNGKSGKKEPYSDVFLTAPTGAGKSLLFQVPAFYLSEKFGLVTIIISPLIALMKDQVNAIKTNRGFEKVAYLNSELSLTDREEVINEIHQGNIDVLYLSPELFLSYSLDYFLGSRSLGLLVVDEAHLVTTWGRDFRVDYWFLGNHLNKLRKYVQEFPILTVTATAVYGGENDMVYDTIDSLYLNNTIKYIGKVTRDNINFDFSISNVTGQGFKKQKLAQTAEFIKQAIESGKKTIIYCPFTTQINEIYELLDHSQKMKVCTYYGKMDSDFKQDSYLKFLYNNVKIMLCTKAFGMGIDIPDIEVVYHHAASGNLADYVQEVGRAARLPKIHGIAKTSYTAKDLSFTKMLYGLSSIKPWELSEIMRKIYKVYEIKKSQNFLVDINQFQHIYPDDTQLDNKIKSGIMMIEKDLLQKYGFNVLIGRPKNLFAHVYARIINNEFEAFIKRFGKYTIYIKNSQVEERGYKVLCIKLDELWTDRYSNMSFPLLKSLFFKQELFTDFPSVSPQQELELELSDDYDKILPFFRKFTESITKAFDSCRGRLFKIQDFEVALGSLVIDRSKMNDTDYQVSIRNIINKISTLIFKTYIAGSSHGFLQRTDRTGEGNQQYKIISSDYQKIMSEMLKRFVNHFGGLGSTRKKKYYLATKKTFNEGIYMMSYLLEALELGTYIVAGGKMPVMFIRLNDPQKFKKITESYYENKLLNNVYKRHLISMALFRYFFSSNLDNNNRWNFIEEYFLGEDAISLIEKYAKISGHNYLEFIDEVSKFSAELQFDNN